MKIWIDISNAPHVNFFKDFINEWKEKYEVIVTTRPLSNTIDLLEKNKIEFNVVGTHYGKKSFAKLFGFFKRSNELYKFLKFQNIDIAISQSSFYSPFVAKKLKIKSIYTNDNEFAKGNYIGFFLANRILLPEALGEWVKGRFFRKKVLLYPGVKEGIYIKLKKDRRSNNKNPIIYFRPEPWHAQYHDFDIDTFDNVLIDLAHKNKIIVLSRDSNQMSHYKELSKRNTNINVPISVETVETISENCDIFLGAGGSMTREFAIMGIPTISLYQGELLEVDKYLINNGVLVSEKIPSRINQNYIDQLIENQRFKEESYEIILDKGKQARNLINKIIQDF